MMTIKTDNLEGFPHARMLDVIGVPAQIVHQSYDRSRFHKARKAARCLRVIFKR